LSGRRDPLTDDLRGELPARGVAIPSGPDRKFGARMREDHEDGDEPLRRSIRSSMAETGSPGDGAMTVTMSEHNKRLVRRALEEIYARGDFELANELVHRDFVDHEPAHPGQPTGPESVKQTARRLQSAFGGLRFEVEDEIAEGDKVVQLVTMSGRHTGPLMGGEPTGREFAVRHTYIWRIADDKIVDHWGSRDDLGLLAQLGLLPVGEEPEAG
jgi:predicted ester cyclase